MIIAFFPGGGGNRYLQRMLGKDWTLPGQSYDQYVAGQLYEHRYLLDYIPKKINGQPTLTHCMNSAKIKQIFPGEPIVFIKSDLKQSLQREWALHGHERFKAKHIKHMVSRLEHYAAIRDHSWPVIESEDGLAQLPIEIQQEVNNDYDKVINGVVHNVPGVLTKLTQNIVDQVNSAYEIITWHQDYYEKYPVDFAAAYDVVDIDTCDLDFGLIMQQEFSRYHSEIFQQVWNTVNE